MIKITDHLEKLPVFLAVVRLGSIRAASKSLGMSQPAVSRTIQILEECLEHRLFIREQKGVQLTEFGHRVVELSQRIQKEVERFNEISPENEVNLPRIKLGTYESIAIYFLPDFLNSLSTSRSPIKMDLVTATSDQLIDYLRRNVVDIIVSVNTPLHKSITSKKLFDDYYGFYHAPTLQINKNTPVIFFPNAKDSSGRKIASHVNDSSLKDNPQFLCESFEPIRALTKAQLGIGVLPTRVAANDVKKGEIVEWSPHRNSPTLFGKHSVSISCLKHRSGDQQITSLIRLFERFDNQLNRKY